MIKFLLVFLFSYKAYSNTEWENIKLAYDFHFKGMGGIEKLTSPQGEMIINNVQQFINSPKNKKFIDSQDGKDLLSNHARYLNYLSAKKILDQCQNNKDSSRKLEDSIVTGILDSNIDLTECKREVLLTFQTITEIYNDVTKISDIESKPVFQDLLYQKSILNTLDSYLQNHYKYNPDFFKNGFNKDQANKVLRKFCKRDLDCQGDLKNKVMTKIRDFSYTAKEKLTKTSPQEVTNKINYKIHNLNKKLSNIVVERDKGFFSDYFENGINIVLPYMLDSGSPDLENKSTQGQFNDYLATYLDETSKEEGLLMHTESIRDAMGNMRTIQNDENIDEDTSMMTSTYKFEQHDEIDLGDTEDAIKDMYRGIDEQINKLKKTNLGKKIYEHRLAKMPTKSNQFKRQSKKYKKNIDRDIKFLLKTNPKAVSQVLAENPNYATLVCSSLIEIDKDDENSSGNGDAFLWGGIGLGVAGLLTGGIAWIGAGVLSAGAIATLGTVTSGLIIASTASSVVGGTISFTEAYNMNKEAREIENGILSGSSYISSTEQMRDFYLAYKNALYDASINTTMSIAGMGALGALNKLGKNGAKFKTKTQEDSLQIDENILKNLGGIYNRINKDPNVVQLFKHTKKELGENGQEIIDEFLGQLSLVTPQAREKFFIALSTMTPKSNSLKKLIENTKCKK